MRPLQKDVSVAPDCAYQPGCDRASTTPLTCFSTRAPAPPVLPTSVLSLFLSILLPGFATTGSVAVTESGRFNYSYHVQRNNQNLVSLAKLSTRYNESDALLYSTFGKYQNYYQTPHYANDWILAALQSGITIDYQQAVANFRAIDFAGRKGRYSKANHISAQPDMRSCVHTHVCVHVWKRLQCTNSGPDKQTNETPLTCISIPFRFLLRCFLFSCSFYRGGRRWHAYLVCVG